MIAADLRPGDRFRPDCGRDAPLHTAHTTPRRDGVNAGLVHLREMAPPPPAPAPAPAVVREAVP